MRVLKNVNYEIRCAGQGMYTVHRDYNSTGWVTVGLIDNREGKGTWYLHRIMPIATPHTKMLAGYHYIAKELADVTHILHAVDADYLIGRLCCPTDGSTSDPEATLSYTPSKFTKISINYERI